MPSSSTFVGFGSVPTLVGATAIGRRTIRLLFSEFMRDDAALGNVASYTLTPLLGSTARTILVAIRDPADFDAVLLTVDGDLTLGVAVYNLEVTGALLDLAGNPLAVPVDDDFDVNPSASGIPDHEALALSRLIAQYRGQPNIEAVVRLVGQRTTRVDQEAANVDAFDGIDTAYGVGLDEIGSWLELGRAGAIDSVYRIRLRGMILAHASQGHPDQVIGVLLELLAGSVVPTHEQHFPAAIVMEAVGIPNEDGWAFAPIVRRAVPAGVQFQLLHSEPEPGVTLFGWDEDPGAGPWAETDGDPAGGIWAEAS